MDSIINKIKETGYWKVIIRPVEFDEKRIADKDTAAKIVEDSKIAFRGWDYPHIDRQEGIVRSGSDSVSSFCDWSEGGHFEFWKLYLNGQFVHYFSIVEDYKISEKQKQQIRDSFHFSKLDKDNQRFLSIINALYTVTEIYFFAANLAKSSNFGKEIEIIIELDNVDGRALFFWGEPFRHLFQAYICRYQPIEEKRIVQTEELIKNPAELALDFTMDIFKEFNWKDVNKDVFVGDQKKLIERRF
ncbi:MAG: hypothetical protein WC726_00105 [Parcubacteria group bacterium]|jgi:hypothetical protein